MPYYLFSNFLVTLKTNFGKLLKIEDREKTEEVDFDPLFHLLITSPNVPNLNTNLRLYSHYIGSSSSSSSIFIYIRNRIIFYMVFLGVVCKIRLKYSKELLDYKVKNTKTYGVLR